MATAIKIFPVLKDSAAVRFDDNTRTSITKKSSVKFSEQIAVSTKILGKAKI